MGRVKLSRPFELKAWGTNVLLSVLGPRVGSSKIEKLEEFNTGGGVEEGGAENA